MPREVYEDNYELMEALAFLTKYGDDVSLTYRKAPEPPANYGPWAYRQWVCTAQMGNRTVSGVADTPHAAANKAWAMCYEHVSFTDLLIGTRKKPITLEEVKGNAAKRVKRSKQIIGLSFRQRYTLFIGRIHARLTALRDRITARLTAFAARFRRKK